MADQVSIRRNRIPEDDPVATENPSYPVRSALAVPLVEDEISIGALVVANKRGRHPEFTAEDEELLNDLARQAVRALRTARQHEAEKKVEELDALLAVSREITATLDLDKVMQTIVNATAALIAYDRCGIAIQEKGKLRLGAISGATEVDRKDPDARRMEELLQWVYLSGTDTAVTQTEDGEITADRPETEEKFRALFQETGLRSFFGVLLKDEEGKLGVLGFESTRAARLRRGNARPALDPRQPGDRRRPQRPALPARSRWPASGSRSSRGSASLGADARSDAAAWPSGIAVAVLALCILPWPLRIAAPARVLPGRRASVTSLVDGVVGDGPAPGGRPRRGRAKSSPPSRTRATRPSSPTPGRRWRSRRAKWRAHERPATPGAVFDAASRRDEARARIALEDERLAQTRLKAPAGGVIITPRIEERVGQLLPRGVELCVVADVKTLTAEVAIPESEAGLVAAGQPATLKFNPFPGRSFHGTVERVGARVREEGDRALRDRRGRDLEPRRRSSRRACSAPAKVRVGTRRVITALFRKPVRYLWNKVWPLLP